MNTTATRVRQVIAEQVGRPAEEITDGATLEGDLQMDSLHRYELSMELEDEFEIEITDKESAPLKTVGEVVALVERKAGAA